jgi:activator of HSP90 ATPase
MPKSPVLKTIEQSNRFPATAKELYDIYINPARHAAVTGRAVKVSPKPGSKFSAFDGMLAGTTLLAIPAKLIVQRWRSVSFKKTDLDSTLILRFVPDSKGARIDLVHVNVPQHDYAGVTQGWKKYYWKPLRAYLKKRSR